MDDFLKYKILFEESDCAFFVGAGISLGCKMVNGKNYPTWEEFIKDLKEFVIAKSKPFDHKEFNRIYLHRNDMEKAQVLLSKLEEKDRIAFFLKLRSYTFAPIHEHIINSRAKLIITTNYDPLLENAYKYKYTAKPEVIFSDSFSNNYLLDGEFFIWKIHGDFLRYDSIVLSEDQYFRIMNSDNVKTLFSAILLTHRIFFIGCSLNDLYIRHYLSNYHKMFKNHGENYWFCSEKEYSDEKFLDYSTNYGIRLIPYKSDNNHQELTDIIEFLSS